jgi:hypothetical protein
MKLTFASLATALALAGNVSAHYIFQQLTVGSTQYPVFQYIRRNSNFNHPVTGRLPFAIYEDTMETMKADVECTQILPRTTFAAMLERLVLEPTLSPSALETRLPSPSTRPYTTRGPSRSTCLRHPAQRPHMQVMVDGSRSKTLVSEHLPTA